MKNIIGSKVAILIEVTITGAVKLLPTPIYGTITKIKVTESHNDLYGDYWPPAIRYTVKTVDGAKVHAYNKESHLSGYIL